MTVGETNQSRSAADLIKRDDAPEPCPFCRGEAEVFEWEDGNYPTMSARVECECGAKGKCCGASNRLGQLDAQNGLHRQRAIAAWNTRALPAIDPAAIREAALREAYDVVYKWWFGDGNALPQELILALIGEKK